MLILARRQGERVVIGGEVTVTVMEISGQTVRLGIAGPDDMPVYREEIWLAVQAENQAASDASAALLGATSKGTPTPARAADGKTAPEGAAADKQGTAPARSQAPARAKSPGKRS